MNVLGLYIDKADSKKTKYNTIGLYIDEADSKKAKYNTIGLYIEENSEVINRIDLSYFLQNVTFVSASISNAYILNSADNSTYPISFISNTTTGEIKLGIENTFIENLFLYVDFNVSFTSGRSAVVSKIFEVK